MSWCPRIVIICSIFFRGHLILPVSPFFSTIHLTQMKVVDQPKQKTVTLLPLPSEKVRRFWFKENFFFVFEGTFMSESL